MLVSTIQKDESAILHTYISEVKSLSRVRLFATPWTVAYQASPSMEFSRKEYQDGLPFPSPEDLPNQTWVPHIAGRHFTIWATREVQHTYTYIYIIGPSSQGYGFSCGHVWRWELHCEEGWVPKNRCFWTVVLEKTLESPLDCKEIQPVHSKGDQFWVFFGRTDAKAETPLLWPPHAKSWLIGKDADAGRDWGQEEKGTRGWDGWMASLTRWMCV